MKHFILSVDEINKLQMENEAYKQSEQEASEIIAELKHTLDCKNGTIETLKAENDRLKEDYIKLSQQKDLDNARWQKRCTDLHIEDKAKADKYWLVLQEIKAIAEADVHIVGDEKLYYDSIEKILQVITKAEEE